MIKLLLLSAALCRAETVPLSFEDLPRLVAERNENASGAASLAESARARTGHLGRSFLPDVSSVGGAERFQTGSYPYRGEPYGSLEAKVNLFHGGRDLLESRLREGQRRGAEAGARRALDSELNRARQEFWRLVSLRELIALLKKALADNEKNVQMAARRIARGLAAETDRLEFQIHASQLHEDLESAEHETLLVQMRLAAILGAQPGTRYDTPEAVPHDHDDAVFNASFVPAAHPDVATAQAEADIAHARRAQAWRWWTPSLDLYGGYHLYTARERDSLDRRERDDRVIGARISLGLFDGLRAKRDADAFARQAQGYEKQTSQRARAVAAQVEVTKEDLKHEHELVHRAEERIVQGRKYLALTLDEYERGVKNSLDVLGAAQRQTGFERQYVERRREYQTVRCDLLALLGR